MAVDWIKIRTNIFSDPKVFVMARILREQNNRILHENLSRVTSVTERDMSVTCHAVVGALAQVWSVTRHAAKRDRDDAILRNVTLEALDDITKLPGLGQAMAVVGWAIEETQGVRLPRYYVLNGADIEEHIKERNRSRQKRKRERDAERDKKRDSNVTCHALSRDSNVTVTHKEEEEEEDKRIHPPTPLPKGVDAVPIPEALDTPEFRESWKLWLTHLRQKRKVPTETAARMQLKKLSAMGVERAIAAINHSVTGNWQGIFEPDSQTGRAAAAGANPPGRGTAVDREAERLGSQIGVIADWASGDVQPSGVRQGAGKPLRLEADDKS